MTARNFHLLAAEYRWAHAQTGDVVRALQHVFEIDLEQGFRATFKQTCRARAVVNAEFKAKATEEMSRLRRRINVGVEIVQAIADRNGVPVERLRRRSGSWAIGRMKGEAVWMLRNCTQQYSYPDCARLLGMRNHSSAIVAFRKFEKLLAADDLLRARIQGAA